MKIKIFFNKQRKANDGSFPVCVLVYRTSKDRLRIQTGLYTSVEFDDGIFPVSERNHKTKTLRLNGIISAIEEICIANPLAPMNDIKSIIDKKVFGKVEEANTHYLYEYISDFAETKSNNSTKEKYDDTSKKVKAYAAKATLDISVEWLKKFENHLSKTLQVNTISIHMRNIRTVINWCREKELTTNYPFGKKKYKIPNSIARKRNIPLEKIKYLKDMPLNDHREKYRDMFLLMYYLIGINSVDLLTAKKEQLVNGRLEYIRKKTNKFYSIKVEPEALELIEKYKGKKHLLRFCEKTKYKNFSNKINDCLKELIPGVTTYYARHSWATIAYNTAKISKDVISQCLGHSMGSEVTEVYIERDEVLIDEANRKVLDLLKDDS